jgi:hypothetical protein
VPVVSVAETNGIHDLMAAMLFCEHMVLLEIKELDIWSREPVKA